MPAADGNLPPSGLAARVERELADTSHRVAQLPGPAMRALAPVLAQAQRETEQALRDWLSRAKGEERYTPQMHRAVLAHLERALHTIATLDPTLRDALTKAGVDAGRLAAGDAAREFDRFSHLFDKEPTRLPVNVIRIVATGERELIPRFRTSAARYAGDVGADIRRELSVGLVRRESISAMVDRLVRIGGPKGLVALRGIAGEPGAVTEHISEGLFARYRYWGERLVRTETQNAYNVQVDETLREAREHIHDLMRRWDASADLRICAVCAELHGAVTTIDGVFPGGYASAPAHPNCRCRVGAWRRGWNRFLAGRPSPVQRPATLPPRRPQIKPGTPAYIDKVFRERGIDTGKMHDIFDRIIESDGAGYEAGDRLDPAKLADQQYVRESFNKFFSERGMLDRDVTGPDLGDGRVGAQRPGRFNFNLNVMAPDNALSRGGQSANSGAITINRVEMRDMRSLLQKARDQSGEVTPEEARALELILHEHGHSFTRLGSSNAYQGIGLSIEEVTNEVASRIVTRETFGISPSILPQITAHLDGASDDPGMYAGHISSMRQVILNAHGAPNSRGGELLERAAVAFRAMPYDLAHMENWAGSPEAMANVFARAVASIDSGTGRAPHEIEHAAHEAMRGIWGEYRQAEIERLAEERYERERRVEREREQQERTRQERARSGARGGSSKRR